MGGRVLRLAVHLLGGRLDSATVVEPDWFTDGDEHDLAAALARALAPRAQ